MTDRTPPQDVDTEQCVLGAVMIDPRALDAVQTLLTGDDFYLGGHREIFMACESLALRGIPCDVAATIDALKAVGRLEYCGGGGYVLSLLNAIPTAANAYYHAQLIAEKSRLRRLMRIGTEMVDACYAQQTPSPDLAGGIGAAMDTVLESIASPEDAQPLADVMALEGARIIADAQKGKPRGITTGFDWLDNAMGGGLQPDDLITLGARTGTGKTKLSLAILAAAAYSGASVGLISLDMGRSRLAPYLIPAFNNTFTKDYITAREIYNPLEDGELGIARLSDACRNLDPQRRCHIISEPRNFTMQAIAGYMRHLAKKGCKVVVIDQVQNIGGWEKGATNRGEYHAIYNELKLLPRRHHLTLIALHQIGRTGADRPELIHLRDTGCVEEFSDFVWLAHDYQVAMLSTKGGFVLDGERVRAPKDGDYATMLRKPIARRRISLHLAKNRAGAAERRDVIFDYALGIPE